jgi:hypothetical protein
MQRWKWANRDRIPSPLSRSYPNFPAPPTSKQGESGATQADHHHLGVADDANRFHDRLGH